MKPKPLASLSLDLDNKWTYMKVHGDAGWQSFPSYLGIVVPRVLEILRRHNLQITFFIVGQDAALEENAEPLAAIAQAGHEIGNHSFSHEPWFHLYERARCEEEIIRAEEHIERATGRHPIGFRGPGFSFSDTLLRVLVERGYQYDASRFPTYLGPLARYYYFLHSGRMSREQRKERAQLFGKFAEGLHSLHPSRLETAGGELIEIPVTTMPLLKVPFHVSYILYLSTFSPALALAYFRLCLALCRITGTSPSLLLHPLDFLGGDDVSELSFFPAMKMPGWGKVEIVTELLAIYDREFSVVPMHKHASEARAALAGSAMLSSTASAKAK